MRVILCGLGLIVGLFGVVAPASAQDSSVFARVGNVSITVEQVQAAADAAGVASRAELRALAHELLDHELLVREATRRGAAQHPSVREQWRSVMVQRLIAREVDDHVTPDSITEADIRSHYDANPERYRRGYEDSKERLRAEVWRARRDGAVAELVASCERRSSVGRFDERLAWITLPADERTESQRLVDTFGCAHCLRQQNENTTSAFGGVPEPPEWARRNRNKNAGMQ